jgi:hemolysin activation/secretion protein
MSVVTSRKAALLVALIVSMPGVIHAAPADSGIDPGLRDRQLQMDTQRSRDRQPESPPPAVVKPASEAGAAAAQGPTFTLMSVRFTSSDYLSRDQLTQAVQPWLGKQVSFGDLEKIVAAVNALYRANGVYTATAILPKQRIDDGVVLIRLVEGTLGKLKVEDNHYTDGDYVRGWIRHQDAEKTVDVNELESDIQLYNRVNDQRLQAELRAGESFGLTDIVVRVQEQARNDLQVFVDNYGYETTGEAELSALYRRQHLLADGDRGLVYAQLSEGTRALSTSYNRPVGKRGWRVGGSAAYTYTDVVDGDFSAADINGDSLRLGLEASDLFWSRQKYWATLLLAASRLDSQTEIAGGAKLSKNLIDTLQGGLQLNWLGERWQLTWREMISFVKVDDQLLSSGDDSLTLHEGSLTSLYRLGGNFYGLLQGGWQLTRDRAIPGSVSYSLGGVYTARGYKPGVISGDRGDYAQLEFHYNGFKPFGQSLDMFTFYDAGEVKNTSGSQRLQSAGVGAGLTMAQRWTLDISGGRSLQQVLPDQSKWVVFARLACQCW